MTAIHNVSRKVYASLISPFMDFIFPPLCLHCQRLLETSERHLCESCWNEIPKITPLNPLFIATHNKLITSQTVSELYSVYIFEKDRPFQALVHSMKYEGRTSIGLRLGETLGKLLQDNHVQADLLIPIPLHRVKLRERGFNQAERIAKGVSQKTGIPIDANLVHRTKNTQTQTLLSIEKRKKNMDEAFTLHPAKTEMVRGRICILVDDVVTTGSTIISCARELVKAGASNVIVGSAALAE